MRPDSANASLPTTAAGWRRRVPRSVRPFTERAPLAAFFIGVSSGAPYAMIAATLTTRLAQDGIRKSTVTTFTLAFLFYNLKFLWAWMPDAVRLPLLGRLGQRVSWILLTGALCVAAIINLGLVDPKADLTAAAYAAMLVAIAGATYDVVIDAYRIELLEPHQLGAGAGMHQYGWRIGSVACGRHRAVPRRPGRLARGLRHLRGAGAAGDGRGADPRRARPASRTGPAQGLGRSRRFDRGAPDGILPSARRHPRAAVHPAAQDRRHAAAS